MTHKPSTPSSSASGVRGSVVVGIYARYSCEKQDDTSLEDQIRRCKEEALRRGLIVDEQHIYTDAAISGLDDDRPGYRQMMSAWLAGVIDVLFVDEFSRMSRDAVEQAKLMNTLEQHPRMRLVTVDGIDTRDGDWHLRLGIQGVLAQHESRRIRQRVERGMRGQLERGYMLAAPPLGYSLKREFDAGGNHIGTSWQIDEDKAAIVREVYARRAAGQSMHQIAAWLNAEGVPCGRAAKTPMGGFWRPSRIKQMLDNTIYRGVFTWHGSTTYQGQCRTRGVDPDIQEYARPALRLVSDDLWWKCRDKAVSRSGYGGGRYALSGLMSCGCCGGTLALTSELKRQSAYCPACTVAKSANGEKDRLTGTVRVVGIQRMLTQALRYFMSGPFLEAFRVSLRQLLTGDKRQELDNAQRRLAELSRAQERFSRLLGQISDDDPVLERRYQEAREKVQQAKARVAQLQSETAAVDEKALQAQLAADPVTLLDKLWETELPPHEVRSVLHGLFPLIEFVTKRGRYAAVFRIRFAPGVAMAQVTGTAVLSSQECEGWFLLTYAPAHGMGAQAYWTVDVLQQPQHPGDPDGSEDVEASSTRVY